jgi:hypothetical protein
MTVQDQYIMGMGGAVAINQMAIHAAMDLYQIEDRKTCFEKVVMVYRKVLGDDREQAKVAKGQK